MPSKREIVKAVSNWYDSRMYTPLTRRFFGGSDFHNYGYWDANTVSHEAACRNLLEQLLSLIPVKKGTILDVACGKGATTKYLSLDTAFTNVVGINISTKQLESCKQNAPRARFLLMDATEMGFADNCFDNVLCVEAAMHFKTREQFFREAWRVLRPGGSLVLSDILRKSRSDPSDPLLPAENYVENEEEYLRLLERVRFKDVVLRDCTRECWSACYDHSLRWLQRELMNGGIDSSPFTRIIQWFHLRQSAIRSYLLVRASKGGWGM